jgi:hypothetical protein
MKSVFSSYNVTLREKHEIALYVPQHLAMIDHGQMFVECKLIKR